MRTSVIYPTYVHDLVEGVSKNVHHLRQSLNDAGVDALDNSPRVDVGRMNRKSVYISQGIAAFHEVRRALQTPSIDIVHYHVSIPGMASWAALARATTRSKKPMVLHMWNPWFDPHDVHVDAGADAIYHRLFNAAITTTPFLGAFDRIVVSSEYQKRQLDARGHDVAILPNGVDLDAYQPAPKATTTRDARRELGLPVDATLLLYYGHLTPWKGVRVLIEALPRAFADNPKAHLVVARTHYGKEEQALRARLHELGLIDRVTFLGICDIPLLLQAVDAGVVPATAAVGTACHPNVVLEYLSAGVPIVASDVGSIPEVVEHGESGLLARPGDPASLGEELNKLLGNESLRARLSAGARRRVEKNFSWDKIAEAYVRTLTSVTGDKRGSLPSREESRRFIRSLARSKPRRVA